MIEGQYVTADNRRLWVFKEAETLGKCTEIPVSIRTKPIPRSKLTSHNNGALVTIRGGNPGGIWYSPMPLPSPASRTQCDLH